MVRWIVLETRDDTDCEGNSLFFEKRGVVHEKFKPLRSSGLKLLEILGRFHPTVSKATISLIPDSNGETLAAVFIQFAALNLLGS